jgi:hypothetical protein
MTDSEPADLLDDDYAQAELTEPVSITISADTEREIELPRGFVELLREEDQNTADVVGDLLLLSSTQRVYETVTYSENDPGAAFEIINEQLQERFEAEFGVSFQQVAGIAGPGDDSH